MRRNVFKQGLSVNHFAYLLNRLEIGLHLGQVPVELVPVRASHHRGRAGGVSGWEGLRGGSGWLVRNGHHVGVRRMEKFVWAKCVRFDEIRKID